MRRTGLLVWVCLLCLVVSLGGCSRRKTARVPVPAAPIPPAVAAEKPGPQPAEPGAAPPLTARVPVAIPAGCQASRQQPWWECVHSSATGEALPYFLYAPRDIEADALLPVVVFLHGSSGSGGGDGKPLEGSHRFGSGRWIREDVQSRYPSVVVVPQAQPAPGETWVRTWRAPPPGDSRPKEALVLVMEVLETLAQQLPVDTRRWYLTGQSMGGFGTWLAYTRYPGRFAALAPVCGGGDPGAVVANPSAVWAFHGDRDTVVPVGRAREMVAAIRSAGGAVRYSEYAGMGHNIFERAYGEPELVDWLFAQRLP